MAHFPTTRLVLFSKVLKDGQRSVALRVTYRRKNRYFFLNRQCFPHQWDASANRFLKSFPDYKRENDILRTYEQRAADTLRDMERDSTPFTFERFEAAVFQDRGGGSAMLVTAWLRRLRDEFAQAGRFGNSRFYHYTANVVEEYRPKAALADIDAAWLQRLERWAAANRDLNDGGLSIYLRTLRAACNRAIQEKIMPRSWYPFAGYSLAHLKKGKAKKAAPIEFFRALDKLSGDTELMEIRQRLALDLFLFSFYTRGMNLADIAELTADNVQGGRITYVRKKTGKEYSLRLNEKAGAILKRYPAEKGLPFFPVYPAPGLSDKQKHYRRVKISREVNTALREIAALIGWEVPGLSFYTARHSYADILKKAGVSVEVISEALGHSDIRTTDAYLKGFGSDVLDRADEAVLN